MKTSIQVLQKMLLVWLILSVIPLIYYRHTTSEAHHFLIARFEEQGNQFLSFVDDRANRLHTQIRNTFKELSQSPLLYDFAKSSEPRLKEYIEHQWLITEENVRYFYQLRYLNTQGKEIIRVESTPLMTVPYIVPDNQLQEKGTRDYFIYASHLKPGEQGSFGIDLEYEHGKPLIPYKPGFRLIYPIDIDGKRYGYFIANLEVLETIDYITSSQQNYSVSFVDTKGYYLLSSDSTKLFGNLIKERNDMNLPTQNPELWQQISSSKTRSGAMLSPKGLYVYKPFSAPLFDTKRKLTLVTLIPTNQISEVLRSHDRETQNDALTLLLLLGLLSGLVAIFWVNYSKMNIERIFSRSVLDNSIPVALTDANHQVLMGNTLFCHLLELEQSELKNINLLKVDRIRLSRLKLKQALSVSEHWQDECDIHGVSYQLEVKELPGSFHSNKQYMYSFIDISEQLQVIDELKNQSQKDPATGLWNKKKFNDSLGHYSRLKRRYKNQPMSCLAIIDIDDFKNINDTYGHQSGDDVIVSLAEKLTNQLRDTDIIARIGGDEFAVILQHIDIKSAYELMHRFNHSINTVNNIPITVSIGITEIDEDSQLTFMYADKALYRSKRKGKNTVSAHKFESLTIVENTTKAERQR
ncbi:GGDEF domain-containing protein [Vibrio salinus]|uniref:GGDEF domain-containing protein n=1 Tax=Vibrio salinus TaxID=2899784 RepID=UPI001E5D4DE2|nr:GGDEF domain-containing protein [Vibrio salinus]MCE0493906.1 sensor domain-containing diguanylate cyclase [Vibrio salinus]